MYNCECINVKELKSVSVTVKVSETSQIYLLCFDQIEKIREHFAGWLEFKWEQP